MAVVKDLSGQRFGRLVAIECIGRTNNGNAKWRCQCDCGNTVDVASYSLQCGNTKSCGCLHDEVRRARATHGQSRPGQRSRLYRIWATMKTRCYNENQAYAFGKYGAKGIKMCDEWRDSFESFAKWAMESGYNDSLTIDRIDCHGMYCPENCRWATQQEQQNNRSNNHRITYNGETHTLAEWSRILGFGRNVISKRLNRGWTLEQAMTTPQCNGR